MAVEVLRGGLRGRVRWRWRLGVGVRWAVEVPNAIITKTGSSE